jgi:hypothetical protein
VCRCLCCMLTNSWCISRYSWIMWYLYSYIFLSNFILISTVSWLIYLPTNSVKSSSSFPCPHQLFCCLFSWWCPFGLGWKRISIWFWFAFPWWLRMLSIFQVFIFFLYFFWELFSFLDHLLIWFFFFSGIQIFWFFIYFGVNPLSDECLAKIFFPFSRLSLHCADSFFCCGEVIVSLLCLIWCNPICQYQLLFSELLEFD